MTYWDMQVHPGSRRSDFPVEKVRELLETSHLIGMGDSWENDLGQPDVFRREMEKGDVVVIRDGGNIVALVRIAGDCRVIPVAERTPLVWFHIARPVEIVSLDVSGASAAYKEATGLEATEGMSLRRTLNRCNKSDFARFWFVTFCGEEEPLFSWVPFYEELAVDKACRKPIQRLLREAKDGKDFEKRLATVYKAKKIRAVFPDLDRIKSMGKEKAVIAMQRVNQHIFRDVVLQNYGGRCCISGLPIIDLLEACHILGWKEDADNRLSPDNGLCMAVIYHRAFDRHLIAIDDDYRLVVSSGLRNKYPDEVCQEFFYKYADKPIRLPERFPPNKFLLAQHRSLLKR